MIKKYADENPDIKVTREIGGQLDHGKYKEGTLETYTISDCTALHLTPDDVEYYGGGSYSTQDIKIYAPEDLKAIRQSDDVEVSFKLQQGDKVSFNNDEYEVDDDWDRTLHSDISIYVATKVVR